MKNRTIYLVIFLFFQTSFISVGQNQISYESDKRDFLWSYELPPNQTHGPVDVTVHATYFFRKEFIGNDCRVNLIYKITDIEHQSKYGTLRFKHKGKIYRADELAAADEKDFYEGWKELEITGINIEMTAIGVKNPRVFNVNDNFTLSVDIGKVDRNTNMNSISLNITSSVATNIYYNNSLTLESRIDRMEKLGRDKAEYKSLIQNADRAFKEKNYQNAKSLYQQASQKLSYETYPKNQIIKIEEILKSELEAKSPKTNLSENSGSKGSSSVSQSNSHSQTNQNNGSNKQTTNTENITTAKKPATSFSGNTTTTEISDKVKVSGHGNVQVYQQNGKYYVINEDGTTHETSEEAYSTILSASEKNRQKNALNEQNRIAQNQAQQREIDQNAAKRREEEERTAERMNNINKTVDFAAESFYTLQNIGDARARVNANRYLDGEYSNIDQLERDYQTKMSSLNESLKDLHQQEQGFLLDGIQHFATETTGKTQLAGVAIGGGLMLANEIQNNVQKKRAQEALTQQKAAIQAEIERRRIEHRQSLRNSLLNMFPEGGIPQSKHKIKAEEVYFFIYSFDNSTINNPTPSIQLSNVFPLGKYSDGTWPYKTSLNSDITKLKLSGNQTLVGFYTTKEMAQQMHNTFKKLAGKSEMAITEFNLKGKPKVVAGSGKSDFWGESVNSKVTNNSTPVNTPTKQAVNDDFWGEPVKTTPPPAQGIQNSTTPKPSTTTKPPVQNKKTETKPVETDFWGTPIKKNN